VRGVALRLPVDRRDAHRARLAGAGAGWSEEGERGPRVSFYGGRGGGEWLDGLGERRGGGRRRLVSDGNRSRDERLSRVSALGLAAG
jgi:hypothetical protein